MRSCDKQLEFFLDGVSQGPACFIPHGNIYAVVDLYGQCAQVSIPCATPIAPLASVGIDTCPRYASNFICKMCFSISVFSSVQTLQRLCTLAVLFIPTTSFTCTGFLNIMEKVLFLVKMAGLRADPKSTAAVLFTVAHD